MKNPKVRNRFDRLEVVNPTFDNIKHPTKQEFLKEVNINSIMQKARNGISPPAWMTQKTPFYGEFNPNKSFTDAFNQVQRATEAFNALPLEFRKELDHDPRNLPNAPRELYEKHGLLKGSATAPVQGSSRPLNSPEGSIQHDASTGQQNLTTSQPGTKKGGQKAPISSSEES